MKLNKYPRTRHLEGSRLQPGDEDLDVVAMSALAGAHLVVEEKIDGANAALSFGADGELLLQSRGHYLTGGPRERHFALLKTWASCHAPALHARVRDRYVVFGEWCWARHTIYYDQLPHFFLEFDVLDRSSGVYLSTPARRQLLEGLPLISVPVLHHGAVPDIAALTAFVGPSSFKSGGWREVLTAACVERGLDAARALEESDPGVQMEGLYVKHEAEGRVVGRYKWVRWEFLQTVAVSGSHWLDRPLVPNRLRAGVDIFAAELGP